MSTQSNGPVDNDDIDLVGATASGTLQTSTVELNSIVVTLTAKLIDGSGWSFK